VSDFRRRFWISLLLTVPVLALAPVIQGIVGLSEPLAFAGDAYVQFALATVVYLYGGWPFLKGVWSELTDRQPGMMTLIGLAITVAYVYSSAVVFGLTGKVFYWELATLIDVMLLGHWIEMRSVMGASGALEELVDLMPSTAHRIDEDGYTEEVEISHLEKGDRVRVKPGEKIPTDGEVLEGHTSVNEALLTGESVPVEKSQGDDVIGGSVNGESAIIIEVQGTGEDTYLSQVIEMVRAAQESRSRTQDFADRAAMWLTTIAISAGVLTLALWLTLGSSAFDYALERMVTVMVITCPHALGLAIPLVIAVSTSIAAKQGLLIRDRSAFEQARELDAVVFDKTGTLTQGLFGVMDVVTFGDRGEDELLSLAASVESQSEHPIARGIVEEAKERSISFDEAEQVSAIPGRGVEGKVDGREIKVVRPEYTSDKDDRNLDDRVNPLQQEGKTVVLVLIGSETAGAVALADMVREESYEAVERLKSMGLEIMMLTGDSETVARRVARELDLDDVFAGVLPDDKAQRIREVKERGLKVAMVGDGVNDAPALVEADVGIAIGSGTHVAIESAGIVLVRSDPRDAVDVVELARRTYKKMVQNLWWATGYNAVAIPVAAGALFWAGIMLSPAGGAVLMSASTVIVAANARLLAGPQE
jgi:Cu2+-exporting ATPase